MAILNAQITARGADFLRVFSRLSGAEFRLWMNANGATVDAPPAELLAEGALTWWDWNGGDGTISGSPAKYFATGMDGKRGYEWYALAKASFESDPAAFVNLCTDGDDTRAHQLIRIGHDVDLTPVGNTRVALWNVPLFNSSEASGPNVAKSLDVYRSTTPGQYRIQLQNGSSATNGDITEVLARLLAQPVGQRFIRAYGVSSETLAGLIYSHNATHGRSTVFDLAKTHPFRRGLSMEAWREEMLDAEGPWVTFLSDLKDAAIAELGAEHYHQALDGMIFDVEQNRGFFAWQRGDAIGDAKTIDSIDAGADTVTFTAAHDCETGDAMAFSSADPTGGITAGRPYFVNVVDSTTVSLHATLADAAAGTNKIDISSRSGTATRRTEVFDHFMALDNWEWLRTNVFKPVTDQGVWDAGVRAASFSTWWTWNTDHRAMAASSAFAHYYHHNLKVVIDKLQEFFPHAVSSEYESFVAAKATHSWDHAGRQAFGNSFQSGSHQSLNLYGAMGSVEPSRYRWYWPVEGNQTPPESGAARHFARVAMVAEQLYALKSASSVPFIPWLDANNDGRPWAEFVFFGTLAAGSDVFFYNSESVAEYHQLLLNAVAEVDAVCQYRRGKVEPCPLIPTHTPAFVYMRVWSGNRWVWRVVPNLAEEWDVEATDGGVHLTVDEAELFIPRATLHEPASPLSADGFWVYEAAPEVIPAPAIYFTAGRILQAGGGAPRIL